MRPFSLRSIPVVRRLGLAALAVVLLAWSAAIPAQEPAKPKQAPENAKPKTGLILNAPQASKGYTLIDSLMATTTYLVDMEGRVVRTWKSDCNPGASAYLLPNGNLLRTGQAKNQPFFGGGAGGRIQEFTWDGKLVWDYTCCNDTQL